MRSIRFALLVCCALVCAAIPVPLVPVLRAQTPPTGLITGTIRDAGTGQALSFAEAMYQNTADGTSVGVVSDATGVYRMEPQPGVYLISFASPTGAYLTTWYPNSRTAAGATPVALQAGKTVVIDVALTRAGVISGTVTVPQPAPADAPAILAFPVGQPPVTFASGTPLASSGQYQLGNLETGSYYIQIRQTIRNAGSLGFSNSYYTLKASAATADSVAVTVGQTTTVNIDLTGLGAITGRVTNARTGAAARTLSRVEAVSPDGETVAAVFTTPDGRYTLPYLAPGTYTVVFTGRAILGCS